nr:MAG: major capsid protein [Microviridae sp.]
MKKEIGGKRISSGNKMTVDIKEYGRSTHDLGYLWRSTMAPGTIVPFCCEMLMPGDTFDIDLQAEARTLPTLGNLYGEYSLELHMFEIPMRLYNKQMQYNKLGIGMNMQNVILPQIAIQSQNVTPSDTSYQINPSNILSYLGIRGLGYGYSGATYITRNFQAMPLLAYWDIFKNYFANKQETNAYVISGLISTTNPSSVNDGLNGNPLSINAPGANQINTADGITLNYAAATVLTIQTANNIFIQTTQGPSYQPTQLFQSYQIQGSGGATPKIIFSQPNINTIMLYYTLANNGNIVLNTPTLKPFALTNIDDMRELVLSQADGTPYIITGANASPYMDVVGSTTLANPNVLSQQGLAIKTYKSDLFNNWMQTTWQTQISAQTAVSTVGNSFTMDQIIFARKAYEYLNAVAISGGSYEDWVNVTYGEEPYRRATIPMYCGGLIKNIQFQEVVASTDSSTASGGQQFLGQQAARGKLGSKHKGGQIVVRAKEHTILMGVVSITPKVDYSQGNKWHNLIITMNDWHKPAFDQIGFQSLITDQIASWDTLANQTGNPVYYSAGLQPSWMNYMTNTNQTYGNFAIPNNMMYMTLNRRYTQNTGTGRIQDLTTYIDPTKFNFIFAQTSLDAQNFQIQIACNIEARRKMSAKIMPNL